MGEHVCIQRKAAEFPNMGCCWCGNREPPLSMYRVVATTAGRWRGPFCNKQCFVTFEDEPSLKHLYVQTYWGD